MIGENEVKEIEILGANRFETYSKTRIGCRGIVIENGKMLVSREEITDWWLIPGGGLEKNETLAECCKREVLEETGYIIEPMEEFLVMNEYYEEYRYVSHYFICKLVGEGEQHLTEAEKNRGLVPMWVEIPFFADIVSKHQEYASTREEKRGSYLREYTAIREYLGLIRKSGED